MWPRSLAFALVFLALFMAALSQTRPAPVPVPALAQADYFVCGDTGLPDCRYLYVAALYRAPDAPVATATATSTAMATATPTATPTATSTPTPRYLLANGEVVQFKGGGKSIHLQGIVRGSERVSSLTPAYGTPIAAQGVFLVAMLDIENMGLESDYVSAYSSFRVRDSVGRLFDIASSAQSAAQNTYNLPGVYDDIQPGFTVRMVFAFDVLPASESPGLVSRSPL